MTVGQRIAQKRKELGLSQEGLGARLGVSRQAIYKWESDAALPEIEKLVNLSREFSVSIDWLLGQEDEAREPRELTAEQLRMVEEIVGRYLAAQPKAEPSSGDGPLEEEASEEEPERPKKRRRWPFVLAGLAAVVLIGVFSNLFSRLDRLYNDTQNLQMNVGEISYDVNSQIYSITQRVEEILQNQNTLAAEQSAKIMETDYVANTVTVSARAVPRTFVEGMTAEFVLISDGEAVTVPGELGDDHAFTAQITGPLSDDITVSVAFLTGDQRQTQQIEQFIDQLYFSRPDMIFRDGCPEPADPSGVNQGKWIAAPDVSVYVTQFGAEPEIVSMQLGVFQDHKLLAWYSGGEVAEVPGFWHFALEEEVVLEEGVPYFWAALVTDDAGRTMMFTEGAWVRDGTDSTHDAVQDYTDPAEWEY